MYVFSLFLAGIGAGLMGYLVGLASLVSYPVMVALGIPPVLANTSNTVGLLGAGIGSVASSWRRMLAVKVYPLWPQVVIALVGGLVGGLLLLVADDAVFEAVVPWLILLGTILVALGPKINGARNKRKISLVLFLAILLIITIYGGYFGAGAGVLFFALCMLATPMTVHEALLMKTPLLTLSNFAAAVLFIVQGQVDWAAALYLGAGTFVGGYTAPRIQEYIPENILRFMVVVGGLTMAIWLFRG